MMSSQDTPNAYPRYCDYEWGTGCGEDRGNNNEPHVCKEEPQTDSEHGPKHDGPHVCLCGAQTQTR